MITAWHCSSCPSDSTSRWTPCPPEDCRRWLQVRLGCIRLSLSCPFRLHHTFLLLRPARHYPRFRIWHPSSGRQRDLNPPEQRAAQRTLCLFRTRCDSGSTLKIKFVNNEALRLPLIPHRTVGIQCDGSIVAALYDEEQVTLQCNACGAVVGTVNAKFLEALEQAIADSIVIHKFEETDPPDALTSISEECQRGDCESCPGMFHRADTGDETVFCVHSCHRVEPDPGSVV